MSRINDVARLAEPPDSLRELFLRYQQAPEGRSAAPKTREQRDRAFRRALERWPGLKFSQIENNRLFRSSLYDWRDTFADRPAEGQKMIWSIGAVFNWAVDRGWMRDNPAAGMKSLWKPTHRADDIWSPEQLQRLMAAASPPLRKVITIAAWTGLREGDVLRLTADTVDEGWLTVRPAKTHHSTNVLVQIPFYLVEPLLEVIVPLAAINWLPGEPFLRRADGSRWNDRYLREQFQKAKAVAGLGDSPLRFHDLRGTLITRFYEAGCTDAEVGSVSGHSIARGSVKAYAARTRPLAENAYGKLLAYLEKQAAKS